MYLQGGLSARPKAALGGPGRRSGPGGRGARRSCRSPSAPRGPRPGGSASEHVRPAGERRHFGAAAYPRTYLPFCPTVSKLQVAALRMQHYAKDILDESEVRVDARFTIVFYVSVPHLLVCYYQYCAKEEVIIPGMIRFTSLSSLACLGFNENRE